MSVNLKIRNIIQFAFSLLLMAGLSSCIMDTGFDEPGEMTSATLRLSTRSSVTRADGKDELEKDPYAENEDKIGRVALFFYTDENSTSAPFFVTELNVEEIVSADVVVKIPEELVTGSNFPGNKAYAYALANLPADVRIDAADGKISVGSGAPKAATQEALQALWVGNPGFVSASAPATFVMRGGGEIELQEDATGSKTASGTILLERLASKIRLWADIPDYLYIDKTTGKTIDENASDFQAKKNENKIEKWESVPVSGDESNVNLYLYNLTQRGRIDGYVGACIDDPEDPEDLAYANIENAAKGARKIAENVRLNDADKDETYTYSHETAYYSYPNVWDGDSPSEQHRTHVVISVPWRRVEGGDTEYRECYYSVPVNALTATTDNGKAEKANCLEPNCYYRIKVRIGMLGNTNRGEAIEIPASYEVVPWSTANVDVNIKDRRYLVVNQKEWVMNNVSTLQIPFATSHKTKLECYVNYFRYVDIWGTTGYAGGGTSGTKLSNEHNSKEFDTWKTKCDSDGEGYHTTNFGKLYCRPRYFVGPYYVGREHPYTIDPEIKGRNSAKNSENEETAWETYNQYGCIDSLYSCTIDHENSIINFNHPLIAWEKKTSGGTEYYVPQVKKNGKLWDEYSRCEIIIKIKHADWDKGDGLYEETLYITQYPGIYVEEDHDYGMENQGKTNENRSTNSASPYVLVNGNNTNTYSAYFARINFLVNHDGSNNNPNMYVIHVTQLSDEDDMKYEIGDPRTLYYNNDLISYDDKGNQDVNGFLVDKSDNEKSFSIWTGKNANGAFNNTYGNYSIYGPNYGFLYTPKIYSARRLEDNTTGILKYYYPTDETPEDQPGSKTNFIAPVLRVAASYGKAIDGSKEELRRRCATYQEAGRPAGRWRLPTKAEIKFIAQLSADGKIPILFGSDAKDDATGLYKDGYYWSAQGGVIANGYGKVEDNDLGDLSWNGAGVVVNAARCVYDEWYWVKADGSQDVITETVKENGQPDDEYWGHVTTFMWGDKLKDNTQAKALVRKYVKNSNETVR